MSAARISRRAVLAGLAVATAAPALAQAQAYSSVAVDVGQLRAFGIGAPQADFIRASLAQALQRHFAGRLGARGAPQLVVRLTALQLTSQPGFHGGSSDRLGGGGSGGWDTDYLDGEALVVSGRQVLLRHPQLLALPSSAGGAWYLPTNEQRRVAGLCEAYASWLARAV